MLLKPWIYGGVVVVSILVSGCYTVPDETAATPDMELGKNCYISQCSDCVGLRSCPLEQQDILGASCSCRTPQGIQYGSVSK